MLGSTMCAERLRPRARPTPRMKELLMLGLPCALVAAVWFAAVIDARLDLYYEGTVHDLASHGDTAGVERALARGISVNATEAGSGRTALMAAAGHGHLDLARR